jgi:hypothetical protein
MLSVRSLPNAVRSGEHKLLLAKSMHHDYSYEQDSDKRNEGPPRDVLVPPLKTMVCPEGRVYCAHNCMCMLMNVPACHNSIGRAAE